MANLLKKISDLTAGTPLDTDIIPYVDLVAGVTKKATKTDLKGVPGDAATVDAGTTTTLAAGESATVTNVGTTAAAVFNFAIPQGIQGVTGAKIISGAFDGNDIVFTLDDASTVTLTGAKLDLKGEMGATIVSAAFVGDDLVFTKSDTTTVTLVGALTSLKGNTGDAATITVGTVTTVAPGVPATVTNSGTVNDAVLDFEIPQGTAGEGSGDVVGPATAIADHVVTFNSTTGKLIKDSGLTISSNTLKTDNTSGNTDGVTIKTGDSSAGNSGNIVIQPGTAFGDQGTIELNTANNIVLNTSSGVKIIHPEKTYGAIFDSYNIATSNKTFTFPNTTGTIALTSNIPVKATGAEVDTGTDDAKFLTAKSINDSHNVPMVAPGTSGNVLTSNGTDWTSAAPAAASPTLKGGVTSVNLTSTTTTTIAHGLGKVPTSVRLDTIYQDTSFGQIVVGFYNSSGNFCNYLGEGAGSSVANKMETVGTAACKIYGSRAYDANFVVGVITVDATNITITWTKTGTVTLTVNIMWEAQ